MSGKASQVFGSSVFRKQMIAITGLAMIGFVVAHLSGNLLIYGGPEVFNAYADTLKKISKILWVMRIGLIAAVLIHIVLTIQLVLENRAARNGQYHGGGPKGDRSLATYTMKYTGLLVIAFLALHLYDFTFGNHHGEQSIIEGLNDNESLGLFGLVWNSFKDVPRSIFYVFAVIAVGLHLSHGIESVFQTFGFNHERYTPLIKKLGVFIAVILTIGFGSIPIYVLLADTPLGV